METQVANLRAIVEQRPIKRNFFGPPPLIAGEDPAAYDELLARVSGAVKPSDILEEIWVRDVIDLVWEALRLRRLKAEFITTNAHKGLQEILEPLSDYSTSVALSQAWAKRRLNRANARFATD